MRWRQAVRRAASSSAGLQLVDVNRAVAAARHVVLARPLHLDRRLPADRLGGADRLDDHVGIGRGAPAEAAAGHHHVQPHPLERQPGDPGGDRLVEVRHLVAAPDLDEVVVPPRDGVHRLERGMRQVGELERRLEPAPAAGGRAPLADRRRCGRPPPPAGPAGPAVLGQDLLGAAPLGGALVPLDGERVAALDRGPGRLGDDRHPARDLDHVHHALDRLGRRLRRSSRPWRRTAAGGPPPR